MSDRLEVWVGLECTVNRVGDRWFDQCEKNGHTERMEDLDRFASLGARRIRYPVLWETAQGSRPDGEYDFSWAIPRLARLKGLGLEPIAGLCHHGSGPQTTSLVDDSFPEKLARYARAVAEEFPWIGDYTPVNEPLTTARFSGLYGVWYPHGHDNATMIRCLLNEVKGTVLAMREIRKINPEARLVQTDDMGRAQGTPPMFARVAFENERRWLTFDLLFGRVGRHHPLWKWLTANGASESELDWLQENPCPPDVIGINHYPLSNRFLDHRAELYPKQFRCEGGTPGDGENMRRADLGGPQLFELYPDETQCKYIPPMEIYREVCARYDADVAVTEVHIDGPRESQLRWLNEVWQGAKALREEGARMTAVTVWSLLGSFDWNCLCSQCRFYYEPGIFDIRPREPRPTAIASMTRALATEGEYRHPVLEKPWKWASAPAALPMRPLLVIGSGTLGTAFARNAYQRNLDYVLLSNRDVDLTDADSVRSVLRRHHPWAVVNAFGCGVDAAERQPERAFVENVVGSEILASECHRLGVPLLAFSSDLVFGGGSDAERRVPYTEEDAPSPVNVFGHTKVEMETRVLGSHPGTLVVRTGPFFSPWDTGSFVVAALKKIAEGAQVKAPDDLVTNFTYVPDLVSNCIDLLVDGTEGVAHLNNSGEISWATLVRRAASRLSLDEGLVMASAASDMAFSARRPSYSALASNRLSLLPPIDEVLERCRRDFDRELVLS